MTYLPTPKKRTEIWKVVLKHYAVIPKCGSLLWALPCGTRHMWANKERCSGRSAFNFTRSICCRVGVEAAPITAFRGHRGNRSLSLRGTLSVAIRDVNTPMPQHTSVVSPPFLPLLCRWAISADEAVFITAQLICLAFANRLLNHLVESMSLQARNHWIVLTVWKSWMGEMTWANMFMWL